MLALQVMKGQNSNTGIDLSKMHLCAIEHPSLSIAFNAILSCSFYFFSLKSLWKHIDLNIEKFLSIM